MSNTKEVLNIYNTYILCFSPLLTRVIISFCSTFYFIRSRLNIEQIQYLLFILFFFFILREEIIFQSKTVSFQFALRYMQEKFLQEVQVIMCKLKIKEDTI